VSDCCGMFVERKIKHMIDKSKAHCEITFDLETIPESDSFEFEYNESCPKMDDVPKHGSLKDETKIKEYKSKKLASMIDEFESKKNNALLKAKEEHHKTGLVSYKGRILCLCYAINDEEVRSLVSDGSKESEKKLLEDFYDAIKDYKSHTFIGHNIKEFDSIFIVHRALSLGVKKLIDIMRVDRGYDKNKYMDTMDMSFYGLTWKPKISLHNLCLLLGIETPKDEMDGSEVFEYYLEGEIDSIVRYCSKDVNKTRECYKKLK